VPCLRIERGTGDGTEVEWMYESMDIMRYLGSRQADQ
jgi:glutathione S-transferase